MSPSVHEVRDGARLLGYIAIDSTVGGRARGGLRIAPDLCVDEIRYAARAMTLKYGLLGLPQGGAKAGVFGEPETSPAEKHRLLLGFARAAESLLRPRTYVPEADMGTVAEDIRRMMQAASMPGSAREWRANRSGDYTARSCLAAASALLQRRGAALAGTRVAIEGFGKVGAALALLLHERGVKVAAISTSRGALHCADGLDIPRLARLASERGSRFIEEEPLRIERAALLELPVDLLFPCARFHSIDAGNAARVAARAICAGANDPVSPDAEAALFQRGISYPPDFLTNCGGVLGGTLEFAGVPFERANQFVETQVRQRVADLLERAERTQATMRSLAESEALTRHAALRAEAENPSMVQRLVGVGIEAYRRRWLPEALVSRMATRFLARRFS